jgi:hypothetical protein
MTGQLGNSYEHLLDTCNPFGPIAANRAIQAMPKHGSFSRSLNHCQGSRLQGDWR